MTSAGSILGPILFQVYIKVGANFTLFAGDTSLCCNGKTLNHALSGLEQIDCCLIMRKHTAVFSIRDLSELPDKPDQVCFLGLQVDMRVRFEMGWPYTKESEYKTH